MKRERHERGERLERHQTRETCETRERLPVARAALGLIAIALATACAACAAEDTDRIEGVGTLEFVEVDLGPAIAARVSHVNVREGDRVHVGDTIAVFAIPTIEAEIAQSRAVASVAEANLAELEAGARQREIERAEAELAAREADVRRLADDSTRLAPLVARDMAPAVQMVAARNAVLAAAALRDAAAASLELLRSGTRPERIAEGRAQLARARAGVAAATATAADLVLRSTVDGVVVTRSAEPGEVLSPGQTVATVAETRRPWVRVFLGPQHIPRVNVGDSAVATLDAFPERTFPGRVTSIATRAEYTPRVALTERERADLLYAVRVDFTDTTGMLKAGLPVTVRFPQRGGGAGPGAGASDGRSPSPR